jgi:glyoxylase-like metal-dependent hydrolase (beta-lactamase superfamily II)
VTDQLTWQVGDIRITRVQEWEGAGLQMLVPNASVENLAPIDWVQPFVDHKGRATASMHTLAVEVDDQRILIDTCAGNDKDRPMMPIWHMRTGPFLQELEEIGFGPDRVDTVVCTHLHTDHVGWNTRLVDDRWMPTFSRARTLVAREEWDHWREEDADDMRQTLTDSVQPLFDADLVDLVETNHQVADGVTMLPTPGHTPGHVAVLIESQGESAVVTGDLVHHPIQFAHPDWRDIADSDGTQAEQTRRDFSTRFGDSPTLVIGTHFGGPTAGHLVRDGDAYRLDV